MTATRALELTKESKERIRQEYIRNLAQGISDSIYKGHECHQINELLKKEDVDSLIKNGYVIRVNTDKHRTVIYWDEGRKVGEYIDVTPDDYD